MNLATCWHVDIIAESTLSESVVQAYFMVVLHVPHWHTGDFSIQIKHKQETNFNYGLYGSQAI